MQVHAIQTGALTMNRTFLAGSGWSAVLRRREEFEFPCFVFVIEHPEGQIAIDTGMSARGWPTPGPMSRFVPKAKLAADEEVAPRMRAHGLRAENVRTVLLTHLDPDHRGGIEHFRGARCLVHRREHDFARTRFGRLRARPQDWPEWFDPEVYDLDPQPYGPFEKSKVITERGDVRLVPLPGHTIGQVGVVVEIGKSALFFAADHTMSKAWFHEYHLSGRLTNLGLAAPGQYADTDRRVQRFLEETSAVLLPSHDPETPARLASALSDAEHPPQVSPTMEPDEAARGSAQRSR